MNKIILQIAFTKNNHNVCKFLVTKNKNAMITVLKWQIVQTLLNFSKTLALLFFNEIH